MGGCCGLHRIVVGFTTTCAHHHYVVVFNSAHGKVYSMQYYVIKFVSDLQQVCVVLRVQTIISVICIYIMYNKEFANN